ncbi:MAG: InlB B-repeat-containing protein, partial [Clostridia bacterium]|nr:InlB B-repeat-containing protein [Clostridia bacterium]
MHRFILRSLAVLLCAAMCLPLLSVVAIERDDYTNVAHQDRVYDEILFSDVNGTAGVSSGTAAKWTKLQPKPAAQGQAADPLDADNKVKRFSSTANFYLQKDYIPTDRASVFATDLLVPAPTAGDYPSLLTVKMLNVIVLTLTYDGAAGDYTYDLFGRTGKVAPNTWMRLSLFVRPDETQGLAAAAFDVQFSGDLVDASEGATTGYAFSETVTASGVSMVINVTVPAGSEAGFMLDDTFSYIPGDLWAPTPATEGYGDPGRNVKLDGKVTLDFGHDLLISSVSEAMFSVTDPLGAPVEYDFLFDPLTPSVVAFDFGAHPLATDTVYTIHRAAGLTDVTGQVLPAGDATFATRSREGEFPSKLPVLEMPEEGWVMPDRYNTGYRCDYEDLVDFYEKYPLFGTSSTIVITEALARAYDFEFCGFKLADENEPDLDAKQTFSIFVTATSPVYLHDFYIERGSISNGKSGQAGSSERLTVAWMEGNGSASGDFFGGSNLTLSHCYVHDVKADHMKGGGDTIVEFCYFRDGGTRNPGAHADVVQFMGNANVIFNNSLYYGNRFDIPPLLYEHVANCCFFFKPEANMAGYANVQAIGNWFNGGGYTTYLTPANGKEKNLYITYEHNRFGYGHKWGSPIIVSSWANAEDLSSTGGSYADNGYMTTLQAGSIVFYDGDGRRVYSLADIGESGTVMVNFANYMTVARTYRIEVVLTDADGEIVPSASTGKNGEIRRYTPVSEYETASNVHTITVKDGKGNDVQVSALIEMPDLPHDVEQTLALALPADVTGCTLGVLIYDTTGGASDLIRCCTLGENIAENVRIALPEPATYTVTFAKADGTVIASETVVAGESAEAPRAPAVGGYVFSGWSASYENVQADVRVEAIYTPDYDTFAAHVSAAEAAATADDAFAALRSARLLRALWTAEDTAALPAALATRWQTATGAYDALVEGAAD